MSDLSEHPILHNLGPSAAKAIEAAGAKRTLEPGEELYAEGSDARAFYLVLEGQIEAVIGSKDGEVAVWSFGPKEAIGEHGLLGQNRKRTTGARARTKAVVFEIPAAAFDAHLATALRARNDRSTRSELAGLHVARIEILRGLVLGENGRGCRLNVFAPGEAVFAEGAPGDAAYFVLQGTARSERGDQTLGKMGVGQCFGELAVLDGVPRTASVVAETRLSVLRVEADVFARWAKEHAPLRAMVDTLRQIYRGPSGSSVAISQGTYDGSQCITSVVRYEDGRSYSATKLTGREVMIWKELSQPAPEASVVEHARAGRTRRARLSADRRILELDVEGDAEDVGPLCERMIAKRPLSPVQEARFRWTGTIGKSAGAPGALVCSCVGLTLEDAQSLEPSSIRTATGAGLICGACNPKLLELESPKKESGGGGFFARIRRAFGG